MIDKKPEVLAPAGDRERLEAALRFGADAVYLGGKLFNMRAGTRSFTQEELAEAVKLTHQMGKRLYLTCNTLLNNEEADLLPRYLAEVHEMGVDAAIEIGPGRALTGFVKKTVGSAISCYPVETAAQLQQLLRTMKGA